MVSVVILFATEAIFHWSLSEQLVDEPVATHYGVLLDKPKQKGKVWSAPLLTEEGYKIMFTAVGEPPVAKEPDASVIGTGMLMFRSSILPPRDTHNPGEMEYGTWLMRHGFQGTAFSYDGRWEYHADKTSRLSGWLSLRVRFLQWRERLLNVYANEFDGDGFAIIAAMTLGDKSNIDKEQKEDFSAVGASHILALSGLHLSILVSLYMLLCHRLMSRKRWGRVLSIAGGALLLMAFLMITGMPTSLVRAALMQGIAMLCSLLERRGLSLNNLCLAACVILIVDPNSLFDVGFQLSFTSVGAILIATRCFPFPKKWIRAISDPVLMEEEARFRIARRRMLRGPIGAGIPSIMDYLPQRLPIIDWLKIKLISWGGRAGRLLWDMTVVSVAAQIGSLPLVIYYFHSLPVYGFLLSFILIPLAYLILAGAILFLALPFIRPILGAMLRFLIIALVGVVQWAGTLPGGHMKIDWDTQPPFVIYSRFSDPEIYCKDGEWKDNILFSPYGRVARIDHRLSKGRPKVPLKVDVLWICKGAKGELGEWLEMYEPQIIVLDASLTDYYYNKYRKEVEQTNIPLHDIRKEGAYIRPSQS